MEKMLFIGTINSAMAIVAKAYFIAVLSYWLGHGPKLEASARRKGFRHPRLAAICNLSIKAALVTFVVAAGLLTMIVAYNWDFVSHNIIVALTNLFH